MVAIIKSILDAVEAIWEKQACSLNKRINCKSLKDLNININEKCVTYEGPDSLSDASNFSV
jgi:hypothetical protein